MLPYLCNIEIYDSHESSMLAIKASDELMILRVYFVCFMNSFVGVTPVRTRPKFRLNQSRDLWCELQKNVFIRCWMRLLTEGLTASFFFGKSCVTSSNFQVLVAKNAIHLPQTTILRLRAWYRKRIIGQFLIIFSIISLMVHIAAKKGSTTWIICWYFYLIKSFSLQ